MKLLLCWVVFLRAKVNLDFSDGSLNVFTGEFCVTREICVPKEFVNTDCEEETPWKKWKTKYNKTYPSNCEENTRRVIWEDKQRIIKEHNLRAARNEFSFTLESNEFDDMTVTEVSNSRNGAREQEEEKNYRNEEGNNIPNSIDWREKGAVTNVKNQGNCLSCWAFSAVGSLEGQFFLKTGNLVSLSEQNVMDCSYDYGANACKGGWMNQAFRYVAREGIETEASYPYRAKSRDTCDLVDRQRQINGYVDIPNGNETALAIAVANVGPVSVAISAANHGTFQQYSKGVFYEPACGRELNHGVVVVGYGSENGLDYWLVKNSWGSNWGEDGYIKMARNRNNNCGIATRASYPIL